MNGNTTESLKLYQELDEKHPKGFYSTKSAKYFLEQEEKGKFKIGTYFDLVSIEWLPNDINFKKKKKILNKIVQENPNHGKALIDLFLLLIENDDDDEAYKILEKGFNSDCDIETKGFIF
jgi:hypothetical protein